MTKTKAGKVKGHLSLCTTGHGNPVLLGTPLCSKLPTPQGCRPWGWHPQILANQLTLFQARGPQYTN